jgi:alanyl-tRNA synthetase
MVDVARRRTLQAPMRTAEIRTSFSDFFRRNDHLVVPSASLVPSSHDPSVLLTVAGMQPFKPYFLGIEEPPSRRLSSVQKVFRTVDIDQVGLTARHLTFFEMLGNFSIGDYFKEGAIAYAWEFVREGWGLPAERLWATIYRGEGTVPADEEAEEHWLAVGMPAERIVRLGGDNFWSAGPTGPCGPCSELYLDRGPQHGCGRPVGTGPDECAPGCECDRFMEFWNLVFMQYDRGADGSLTPLPAPSIDTGSGLERVAALLQDVHSVFETDGFRPIIEACEEWSGVRYTDGGQATKALRVLADHGRAMTMLATDGVIPSNEQRGYVLRRVIRRAVSQGQRIGLRDPFLARLHAVVVERLGDAYPDLVAHRDAVAGILAAEEERFSHTLATGMAILDDVIAAARASGAAELGADDAFRLHDTHGFPIEVTAEIAAEHGLGIDEAGFARRMDEQRRRAREAAKGGAERERAAVFAREAGFTTEFVGYGDLDVTTTVEAVERLDDGRLLVKLARSPFYPEGGGQVSDHGTLEADTGRGAVVDAFRFDGDQALLVELEHGELPAGSRVRAIVSEGRRRPTMANHTGTHLLHRALREELGDHVAQRGSAVRPDKLRFDFSHDRPMTAEQLARVEDRVNEIVVRNLPLHVFETSQDEARRLGATMLFGEKYGDVVRVVEIVGYSKELCGGTHLRSTAEVGPFKVLSESSVGQGVRRIEAVTSGAALALLRDGERHAAEAARELKTDADGLAGAVRKLRERVRELERGARDGGGPDVTALAGDATRHGEVAVLAADLGEAAPDALLALSDQLRGRLGASVVVLASAAGGRAHLVAGATPEAVAAGASAGDVIAEIAPIVGGGGGGRPTMARAGGKDPTRIPDALAAARRFLAERLERAS